MTLKSLIIGLLSLTAIALCITRYEKANMADFYNYWGVAAAKQWRPTLEGPYAGQRGPNDGAQRYTAALAERAAQSGDEKFKKASHVRRKGMYLTSTPFLYAAFGVFDLPYRSYTAAWRSYFTLQVLSFVGSIFALVSVYAAAPFLGATLALALVIIFVPFQSDLNVGNLNSIQLGFVTALVLVANRSEAMPAARRRRAWSLAILCGAVGLLLLKPNLALFSIALALHLLAVHGWREFWIRLFPWAGLFGLGLFLWSGATFGRLSVWLDWYQKVFGADPGTLVFASEVGNVSPALLFAQDASVSIGTALIILAAIAFSSAMGAVAWASARSGGGTRAAMRTFADAFRDPAFAASMGITLTFLLLPLAWFHYYVLSLLPALWLTAKPEHSSLVRSTGVVAIVLAAGIIQPVTGPLFGSHGLHHYATALTSLSLWVGLLALLARRRS